MTLHRRFSGVTALIAVVLLLVPAMAWLQYRWVGQVSEAERERMQRTLRTAAAQFATAFDSELARVVVGLQVEGAVVRDGNWPSYAERYTTWTERTSDPRLVREVLLVDAVPDEAAGEDTGRPRPAMSIAWCGPNSSGSAGGAATCARSNRRRGRTSSSRSAARSRSISAKCR